MSKLTGNSDVTEMFGSAIGMAVLGMVLIGGPIVILLAILALLISSCGVFGVAIIGAWLVAGVVCCCMYGMKKGLPKWIGGTAAAICWSAVLFIVIGGPISFIGDMMQSGGSTTMSKSDRDIVNRHIFEQSLKEDVEKNGRRW